MINENWNKDYLKCKKGHKLNLTRQPYKDSKGKEIDIFRCKIKDCRKRGACKDGAYVCT